MELPEGGLGERSLVPQQSVSQSLPAVVNPTIASLEVVSESLDSVAEIVGGLDVISIGDLEKILIKHSLSKKDVTEAIKDAFMQNISGAIRDQSLLVKTQVKAAEVQRRLPVDASGVRDKRFEEIFKKSEARGAGKSNGSDDKNFFDKLPGGYHKVMDGIQSALNNPLGLTDKIADLAIKGVGKLGKSIFGGDSKKEDTRGRGTGEGRSSKGSVDGDIFGPNAGLTRTEQSGEVETNPFSSIFSGGPFGAQSKSSPFSIFGSGPVSNEEDLQGEVAESDLKTNEVMFRTFDEPEKSDFGKFLDNQINDGGRDGHGKAESSWLKGLLTAGLIAGLIFFLPKIIEFLPKFIAFVKDTLIPNVIEPVGKFIKNDLIPFIRDDVWPILEVVLIKALEVFNVVASIAWESAKNFFGDLKKIFFPEEGKTSGGNFFNWLSRGAIVGNIVDAIKTLNPDLEGNPLFETFSFLARGGPVGFLARSFQNIDGSGKSLADPILEFAGTSLDFSGRKDMDKFKRQLYDIYPWAKALSFNIDDNDVFRNSVIEEVSGLLRDFGQDVSQAAVLGKVIADNVLWGHGRLEDGIITSDGQIIHTDPDDSIYAFKGDVSISPANRMNEYSGSMDNRFPGNPPQGFGPVTNNYVNNSNLQFMDLNPAPEFDPVGV
jgi:hypothetical protein